MTTRPAAALVLLLLLACLLAGLWFAIPRSALPSGASSQVTADPTVDFSAAEIQAGDELGARLRWAGYSGLAVGLAVVIILGFWPWGARVAAAAARPIGGA